MVNFEAVEANLKAQVEFFEGTSTGRLRPSCPRSTTLVSPGFTTGLRWRPVVSTTTTQNSFKIEIKVGTLLNEGARGGGTTLARFPLPPSIHLLLAMGAIRPEAGKRKDV